MKILINGYTVSEHLSINRSELFELDKTIGHLKRNRKKYMMVVTAIVIVADISGITLSNTLIAATDLTSLQSSLSKQLSTIIELLKFLVKYTCLGMGLKEMIICLLNGGNMKEATMSGIQYWLGYLFIQFYPSLFDM